MSSEKTIEEQMRSWASPMIAAKLGIYAVAVDTAAAVAREHAEAVERQLAQVTDERDEVRAVLAELRVGQPLSVLLRIDQLLGGPTENEDTEPRT